jgi:CheY-like chemotaxis protein
MAKILVVEDEWIVADQLCGNLRKMGYLVVPPVSSGEEAIQKIDEEEPDLVIMDFLLRGAIDGAETARQIALRSDVPLIFLTAYSSQDILEQIKLTNPAGYLVKPFEDNELKGNIELALHKHQQDKKLKNDYNRLQSNLKSTIDAIAGKID